ncbi:MAG: hypothetical protein KAI29_24130, partial [Cyclobacteriaceae bacterium]|nr:hypothetical protein [Cyclobacteriaceae bacterium]
MSLTVIYFETLILAIDFLQIYREKAMNTSEMETSFSSQDLKLLYEVATSIHAIKDFHEMLRVVL